MTRRALFICIQLSSLSDLIMKAIFSVEDVVASTFNVVPSNRQPRTSLPAVTVFVLPAFLHSGSCRVTVSNFHSRYWARSIVVSVSVCRSVCGSVCGGHLSRTTFPHFAVLLVSGFGRLFFPLMAL